MTTSNGHQQTYQEFLARKSTQWLGCGRNVDDHEIHHALYPFQRTIVRWALGKGRAAIFADCGLGKTLMQLEWARLVGGRVLILAPLAVAAQTVREGERFGISCRYLKSEDPAARGIIITNYERLDHFNPAGFDGIVLDESSILKSYMGHTKRQILDSFKETRWKLACTATPAPNDHMELGNHAEFLNVMPSNEMLSRWFINDTMHAGQYRLKRHGARDFWRWVASWAVSVEKPSDVGAFKDDGFRLPPLHMRSMTVQTPPPEGQLFHDGATLSATDIHRIKRGTTEARVQAAVEFANASDEQCLIWCDTNYEADAIKSLLPECVEVRGSDAPERKEAALIGFADHAFKVLVTKPSIAGFGMNFQQCHRVVFVGLSYSFESLYQAVRRVWRFGQAHSVEALIVESDAETGIRATVERKIAQFDTMKREMVASMSEFQTHRKDRLTSLPEIRTSRGEGWTLLLGDAVDATAKCVQSDSIDFTIFSPPFANLYIYSDSIADMGNTRNHAEFFEQFGFLIRELYRVTTNGRLCAVHCKDLPAYMGRDGAAGLIDFPGQCIRAFEAEGWQYHSRVTIWKDPVIEMQRTKNHGLLHKQLCKDSSASRQGMADYLIVFRKWDGQEFPKPVSGPSADVRFTEYVGEEPPAHIESDRHYSIQVWQRYASPVWFDIQQTRVLNVQAARSQEDEKHICPLQLDVIERAVHLWTNEGDVVFSPFAGIGSEGYISLLMKRQFVGVELKTSYFETAKKNLERAIRERDSQIALMLA